MIRPVVREKNSWPPCRLDEGPTDIAPCVLAAKTVALSIFFVDLAVCAERKRVLLVVDGLPRHDGLGTVFCRNSAFHWE